LRDSETPILDTRDATEVLHELLTRAPAYVPELKPASGRAAYALMQIFARYMQLTIARLNQAPDKNLLGFLDMLGVSLLPAQAARAPVVFQPMPAAVDSRIEARTRVGAKVADRPSPIIFETERAIALAAARLLQVCTLWPADDSFADHSNDLVGQRAFTLFKMRQPIAHELYLAHQTLFAFKSGAIIEIEFHLNTPASQPLKLAWEHWDGQAWRQFKPFDSRDPDASQDGTAGLTRSGVITLRAECGKSEQTTIKGLSAYWVRARLDQALPPDPSVVLPVVDRIRLRSLIERPLKYEPPVFTRCIGPVKPDNGFANGATLNLSGAFFPFGKAPGLDSAFYLSSAEVFNKSGASVQLCFARVTTPEEEADKLGDQYEIVANDALATMMGLARTAAGTIKETAEELRAAGAIMFGVADVALNDLDKALKQFKDFSQIKDLKDKTEKVAAFIAKAGTPTSSDSATKTLVASSMKAAAHAMEMLTTLSQLSPLKAAVGIGADPPALKPPILVWEYWDGERWQTLLGPNEKDDLLNLKQSGAIKFNVPADITESEINGVSARWLRARLSSGSYNRLRIVSWLDTQTNDIHYYPIIEARAPVLNDLFLGYTYYSPWQLPEQCLSFNDFQFAVQTANVRGQGTLFTPFQSIADATPALYLGFDLPLPNDLISLYFDIAEREPTSSNFVWEVWDGTGWRELSITDETAGLTKSGMLSFIPPEIAPRPQARVSLAQDNLIVTTSVLEAAAFRARDQVVIKQDQTSELATIQQVDAARLLLETPLVNTYTNGTVSVAALPRFGAPLDWVRARLKEAAAPDEIEAAGIYLNAAWVTQVQTINDELLGSGTGQPNQSLFFAQTPVLSGEQIEIRELEGARAHVEFPMLKEKALKQGLQESDLRTVFDQNSGRITEVWVRWQARPHLYFSGPEDRHYVVERARGRLIFGDGKYGQLPTVSANNIRAHFYQTSNGLVGNVPTGKIKQVLGALTLAQSVNNPRAAEGGAEAELSQAVGERGPQILRHRERALSARDYEALALAASPAVAVARALPARTHDGRPAPGWITLIIAPHSQEARPQPSFELRRQVRDYLAARAPATVQAARIEIIGPNYLPVGVAALVAPRAASEAGLVQQRVRAAMETFLHPLTGGPRGRGWPFGRNVYLSDVAAIIEAVQGVDYVKELELLLGDAPVGEEVNVPQDRIVVAGSLKIEMHAAKR
jgi:Baseplate J-like protein